MQREENRPNADATATADGATELFNRYSAGLYHYCLARLHSPEEAEDAVQATYLNAWRSLRRGFKPDQGRAWLFQIAANVCSSALRSRLGGTQLELRDPSALDEVAGAPGVGNEELLGLPEALRELPARQRDALLLRDWKGLSYDEIAAEMAVSDSAVETLLFRARNRVAAALSNSDWRRKVAPTGRALLLWPLIFLRPKSAAAATGGEPLKAALLLAGGTVAPLVAFGLIQAATLSKPEAGTQGGRATAVVDVREAPTSAWLAQGTLDHPGTTRAAQASPRGKGDDAGKTKLHAGRKRRADAATPAVGRGPAQPPAPEPTAPGSQPEEKVVVCHSTPSATKPGVTISVSKHALKGLGAVPAGTCD